MVNIPGIAIFAERRTLMELDWSTQSPHIRSLYHPWQPGDGWDEATIQAVEARLGLRLPNPLRRFYLAYGRRRDLTQANHPMLDPDELVVRADTLIFCVENQAVVYWGIQCEALEADDPPVVVTWSGPSGWDVESELNWESSRAHLSGFLDDLLYLHAGVYKAMTDWDAPSPPEQHIAWLEENWSKARVGPLFYGVDAPESAIDSTWPPLYVRDGQAFCWHPGNNGRGIYWLAAREAEALDEISQRFQIKWRTRSQVGAVNNLLEIERPEHFLTWLDEDPPRTIRMWI
jgi:hypothetical protein